MFRRTFIATAFCLLCFGRIVDAVPWVQTSPLPDGYSDHALVYGNGFLYHTGGASNTRGVLDGTNVFYGQVGTGGTVSAWKATTPLPAAISDHAGVAANGFVYVLGGEQYSAATGEVVSSAVYYARTNADGSLGTWQSATSLPNAVYLLSASVWNGAIYVVGGTDNDNFYNTVYSATIQADGSLSAWTARTALPVAVVEQAQAANGMLYVLGGAIDEANIVTASVYYSKINADGSLGGWKQTAPLPQAEISAGAVAAGGRVYLLGGWNSSSGATNGVYNATVLGDGSLNTWSPQTTMPMALYAQGTAVTSSFIFISGGLNGANASSAVYSMVLPPSPVMTAQGFGTNNSFQLRLVSATNTGFGIQASTNLTNWANIGSGVTDATGSLQFQDTNAANFPRRFYRAYWPLP